jgi:ABC-type uncharacterized transport system auxiliary subunit
MRPLLAILFVTPLLASCLGAAPPVPRDHFYRLVVSGPAETSRQALLPGVLTIEPLQAEGLLHERPLLYSQSGKSHEVQQHDYHYWTDAPTRMLQDQMVAYLRRSGIAESVVTPEMRIKADYRLAGKAKRLERLIGGGPPRVAVELELVLVRLADGAIVVADSYGIESAAADDSVQASIEALNRATARVFERFLAGAVRTAARERDRNGGNSDGSSKDYSWRLPTARK